MTDSLLALRGVHKRFGATHALRGVDLDLRAGEVLALVGENGAGKSTLVKILTGVIQPDEGQLVLAGQARRFADPQAAQRAGIVAVHQETVMFDELSVVENIFMGRHLQRGPFIDWATMTERATRILQDIGARFSASSRVKELGLAEQHLVEIARALSQEASVVILDEPTAALSQQEIRDFYGLVRGLRERGVGIIFITHKFDEIFAVADRYVVLRDGVAVGHGDIAATDEDQLVRLMAGRSVEGGAAPAAAALGATMLSVRGLSHPTEFDDLNFDVRQGEILGFYGLVGSGRSEAMLALMGLNSSASGEITVAGTSFVARSPGDAIAAGIAYVPEERQRQGGILPFSVAHNISLAGLARFSRGPWLSRPLELALGARMVERLSIKTASLDTPMAGLSGGNQQKMVIAKWLGLNPKIVILDEPTKGIDVAAKQAVYALIGEMISDGLAVILVSSELPEVMRLAHRVIVMRRGRQVAEYARGQADAETIVSAASGRQPALETAA